MVGFIQNEAAYEAAIGRNIKANRKIGGRKRFFSAHEDAQILINFVVDRVSDHQVDFFNRFGRKLDGASFIDACWVSIEEFGGLTEKQAVAVRNSIAKQAERRAEAKAADALSVHVGTVGERRSFDLTVAFVTSFDGTFGTTYINCFKDADGNVFVHKGSSILIGDASRQIIAKGEKIRVTATIKEHGVRDGVNQTIIARPSGASFI